MKTIGESDDNVSEEELRLIMSQSLKSGEINREEYQFVENVFNFDERMAREIMVPRTEIVAVDFDMSLSDIANVVQQEKYTRYPVMREDKDSIVGVINTKEVFAAFVEAVQNKDESKFTVTDFVRPVITVIETIPIKELLVKMQKEHNQVAILIDEYGGTSGLVSMEDIVEEIVGDISDDFETKDQPEFIMLGENHYRISARMLIDDVNDLFGLDIDNENVDTMGGWLLDQKYDVKEGEEVEYHGYRFKAIQKEKNSIIVIDIFTTRKLKNHIDSADSEEKEEPETTE